MRIEVLPDEAPPARGVGHAAGNFVLTGVQARIVPPQGSTVSGRFVRVELPGREKILSLAEVQVFRGTNNIAPAGEARQSTTDFGGPAKLAIDGNTDGNFAGAKSTTHTAISTDPWWEVDLKTNAPIDRVALWNRTDGASERLNGFRIVVLNEKREPVWEQPLVNAVPSPSAEFRPDGTRAVRFTSVFADYSERDFGATNVLDNKDAKNRGWAIGPKLGEPHALTLLADSASNSRRVPN